MKTKLFVFLGLIAYVFTACSVDGESNSSPSIIFMKSPIVTNVSNHDTLKVNFTDESGVYKLDTIAVGDTVLFQVYLTGYTNYLKTFSLTESADSVSKIVYPRKTLMDSLFISTSNYAQGKFYMPGNYVAAALPFRYIARKASKEAKLGFFLSSDANFEYNTASFVLKTPIKEAKKKE